MVEDDVPILLDNEDIDLIERRMENIGPQRPTVVGDVVVADHREERVGDLVVGHRRSAGAVINIMITVIRHGIMGSDITVLRFMDQGVQRDVVFRLGIGDIPQVGIEQVVVPQADGKHLVHAARIGGQVAVGADDEGIIALGG